MEIFYWLVIAFLLTFEPIYGYFDYQKFTVKVRSNPLERIKYYKKVMVGLWSPALFILGLVAFAPIKLADIGISWLSLDTQTLGKWVTYLALGLGILYLLYIVYVLIGVKFSGKMRQEIANIQENELENSKFVDIMPVTKEEKKTWTLVSWTAGITEEIIYRGFLIFALSSLFPSMSIWLVLVAAALIFGLAHTYQGWPNVIRTAMIGLFFGILSTSLHSILPIMIIHFLIDYIGKIGDESLVIGASEKEV